MASESIEKDPALLDDEDTLFKSLTHSLRRDIIRVVGPQEKGLNFSQIQKEVGEVDSPTLSYHLRNLQSIIHGNEGVYRLTEVGEAAYKLLQKVEESRQLEKTKKHFMQANIATVALWVPTVNLISLILFGPWGIWNKIIVIILLNVVSVTNYRILGYLQKRE